MNEFELHVLTALDVVCLLYLICFRSQRINPLLILFIIILTQMHMERQRRNGAPFDKIFHLSMRLLPLSISLSFYNPNDFIINIVFMLIFLSLMFCVAKPTKHYTYTQTIKVKDLCVLLDYIQLIITILTKIYYINNVYAYKFVLIHYPFCIALAFYVNLSRIHKNGGITIRSLLRGIAPILWWLAFSALFPILLELANSFWIPCIYDEFLSKLRHPNSKKMDSNEKVKCSIMEWLNADKHDLLIKICCINHIKLSTKKTLSKTNKSVFAYLQRNLFDDDMYYKNVTWDGFKNSSKRLKNRNLSKRFMNDIIDRYDPHKRFPNAFYYQWHQFRINKNCNTLWLLIDELCIGLAVFYWVIYAVSTFLNIFIWPIVTACIVYHGANPHQICFVLPYFVLLIITLYKLYHLIYYEAMMWYIVPDSKNVKCSKNDVRIFKEYYKYIKYEFYQIKYVLVDIIGPDLSTIILLYLPDYIFIYRQRMIHKIQR